MADDRDVVDLGAYKKKLEKEEGELTLIQYLGEGPMDPFVWVADEDQIVLLSHPTDHKGMVLTVEQALSLGTALIKSAGMAEFAFAEEEDDLT